MLSIFKNKPIFTDKKKGYMVGIAILSLISLILLMLPVIVNFANRFSTVEKSSDMIYCILRGVFGVSFAFALSVFFIKKDVLIIAIPCGIGFITGLFPLAESIATLVNAHEIAQQLSMSVGYGPYLLTICEHLFYTLLCLFTMLYVTGFFHNSLIIMLISVLGSFITFFTCIDNYITYDITLYEVLSFGYRAFACLVPLLLVLSTNLTEKNPKKYKARRMKK